MPCPRFGVLLLMFRSTTGGALDRLKFSNPDPSNKAAQAAQAAKEDRIAYELSTPCRADLKGQEIMVVIG